MAQQVDTSSFDWMLTCLARHVCRLPTKADRHAFLELMEFGKGGRAGGNRKKSPEFMAALTERIKREWDLMRKSPAVAREHHGDA